MILNGKQAYADVLGTYHNPSHTWLIVDRVFVRLPYLSSKIENPFLKGLKKKAMIKEVQMSHILGYNIISMMNSF